ncbi:MAG: hypothetical protein KDD70_17140 [Bdellovibrionales bacterium]|nr:hypothetical protein [Bdellovibrionales bacterium]
MKQKLTSLVTFWLITLCLTVGISQSSANAELLSFSELFTIHDTTQPANTVTFVQFQSSTVPGVTHTATNWGLYFGDLQTAISTGNFFSGTGRFDRTRIRTNWNNNPCCTGPRAGESFEYASENYPYGPQNGNQEDARVFECRDRVNGKTMYTVLLTGQPTLCMQP